MLEHAGVRMFEADGRGVQFFGQGSEVVVRDDGLDQAGGGVPLDGLDMVRDAEVVGLPVLRGDVAHEEALSAG